MDSITSSLRSLFQERLKEQEPLKRYTNFRIGGPARWFAEVKSVEELKKALQIAKEQNIRFYILGGGSNIIVSDEGFKGLVLKIAMRNFTVQGTLVDAEAGALSIAISRKTAESGLKGFEWAISLPGTIGGAVRGNAGCFGGEMKNVVESVEVLREGELVTLSNQELAFGYRDSAIKHSSDVVIRVHLHLSEGDSSALQDRMREILETRIKCQPVECGSAGCLFKNYEIESDEALQVLLKKIDLPESMCLCRQISAGWLIDQLGLKGVRIDGAQISEKHGNFLLNLGDASASDIVQLISLVKAKVRDAYGIQLQEEVQYLGFEEF
ncbi:MAG: UDP-N-acetylenolpyruvoylglucosamine reductase [Candidatus Uhrbacteria bacterium GW2011_GWE2_40_58]|nr:MAG: UDP-N-acetylenolpyruvoylglucosamine reductase [Candidatus Uhrbacteria bacterium GW2011_GWF2_40_263]KKR67546.1 MAG: UDP-N-acetylenolpyruvoylglucosamine reductase [Candidatus Uhrbacteria bacterium GW2011_GWE2_40_58]OGL93653.1 MAG: UDP-N-acetylenolpyruvoylglucosamine reductase [Candidatus Uhrbacteria bacterium RIFOXYA2_FULL_40_9]OGL96493.1 MAG: UDP-N-acetylenolpyruvoylglucosamine reductase [Candidatus Uhrbacteria bacterium RIFOXYB2_FULL_41_18]HBK34592.1 UDP-N-acetylenolpyruvoylglucosamine 